MKYLLCVLFAFTGYLAFSQNADKDSSANTIAYWKKGEHKVLSIVHSKETFSQGKLKSTFSIGYNADILVLDSTASGYTLQWTFSLPEKTIKENPSVVGSLPVYEGMKMVFKTSQVGAFLELSNWQEVKDAYIKMMEISLPEKLDSAAQAAIDKSKELFNSKEMVEASLIREIQIFHSNYGYKFTKSEIKAETELANPFADEPLPAIQTFRISELNPGQDYFKLIIEQEIDKKGATKFFENFLKKMKFDNSTIESETKKMLSSFEIKDHSEYQFILSTGWLRKIDFTRSAKNAETNQIDSYFMKME
jgi:hypothetical protein